MSRYLNLRVGCARYSVPGRLRGLEVEVMVDGQEVRILHRGGEVALHELQPPGGMSIKDEHYSSPRPTRIRPLRARLPEEVAFFPLWPLRHPGSPLDPGQRSGRAADEASRGPASALTRSPGCAPAAVGELPMVTAVAEQLDPELVGRLRRLKLRRIREVAGEVCLTARTQRWRPEELLRVLVAEECKARDEANRQARLKQAGFPVDKRLRDFSSRPPT